MKKRIIVSNIIVLLVSLVICIGVSLYVSRRNVLGNARKMVENYATVIKTDMRSGYGTTYVFDKFKGIEKELRITVIRNYNDDGTQLLADNKYALEDINEESWLNLPEISTLKKATVRYDATQKTKMIYYCDSYSSDEYETYIRVGLPYGSLFEDNTSFLFFTIVFSGIVFVFMSIMMGQSTYSGMKPINKVIGSLEGLTTTSNQKEYNFSNLEDISLKIGDIKNELEKNIQKVNNEKNKVELILENMGQGLIALNEDYNCILINKYAQNVLFENNDVLNKNFMEFVNDEKLKEQVRMVCEEKGHLVYDKKIDELYYTISINSISNIWGNGESRRIIIVITDVTDEKNGDLRQKEFFNNASHELRSPLTSIVGFQELICEGFVEGDEVLELCKRSLLEGRRMQNLINDMLDLAALEKEEKGEIACISLKDTVKEIVDSLEPQLLVDNLSCVLNIDDSYVIANQRHIYQLIRNLIDNAIKYNVLNGKIYVDIKGEEDNVIICVMDTGVGISSQDQTQIFERFYRVDKARSRKLGSSGLGLSIVRQVCNIYGASISIESKLKEGTKISIKFPKK